MSPLIVGVSDCKISGDPEATLITYALGSCVGVALHDPEAKLAGLLHFLLPEAALNPARAERNPYMFGDTGIARLLEEICGRGARRNRLSASIAGGARVLDVRGSAEIGQLNSIAAREALRREGVSIASEALGGGISRTLRIEAALGRVTIR